MNDQIEAENKALKEEIIALKAEVAQLKAEAAEYKWNMRIEIEKAWRRGLRTAPNDPSLTGF